jgi:alanine transaminase
MSKIYTPDSLNPNAIKTQYAVRGAIVIRADEINKQLKNQSHGYPFNDIVFCNIGNPQQLGQKPITFFRNVLSLVTSPELIQQEAMKQIFKPDVFTRAETILKMIDSRSTGAYTHSQGLHGIRQNVANFIKKRDNLQVDISPDYIFLTDGASPGIQGIHRSLISSEKDAIMIPVPQYPLYSASIQLFGGTMVGYHLDEQTQWGLDTNDLEKSFKDAVQRRLNVRALVIINPGNPTGNVLSLENMQDIVFFCEKNRILLLADEVYQENVYGDRPFHSFNRIIHEMGKAETFEMVSFHSVSKGYVCTNAFAKNCIVFWVSVVVVVVISS